MLTLLQSREEIAAMRSTQDPIQGLKHKILEWEVLSENELKAVDREAKALVEKEVAEAEACPDPDATAKNLFEDIYVPGSEPAYLRGRTVEGEALCVMLQYYSALIII
jgi:pyruvate dehydrogenase E1 component alpha subunit